MHACMHVRVVIDVHTYRHCDACMDGCTLPYMYGMDVMHRGSANVVSSPAFTSSSRGWRRTILQQSAHTDAIVGPYIALNPILCGKTLLTIFQIFLRSIPCLSISTTVPCGMDKAWPQYICIYYVCMVEPYSSRSQALALGEHEHVCIQ
jgi:hypothetical protein